MLVEFSERMAKLPRSRTLKDFGMVAVALGSGLNRDFPRHGGGSGGRGCQTMTTQSTTGAGHREHRAVRCSYCLQHNIILAAQQASELYDLKVLWLPTKSVQMGIAAGNRLHARPLGRRTPRHAGGAERVHTRPSPTVAQDTTFDERVFHEGDSMGLVDNRSLQLGSDGRRGGGTPRRTW
jgi:dihydroxyacetone kinase-like predicted kinase